MNYHLSYDINDALHLDKTIEKTAKKIVAQLKKGRDSNLRIYLCLKKDQSIYKIDEYFTKLFSAIRKMTDIKFGNVIVNFGEQVIGKYGVRYLFDDATLVEFCKLQNVTQKFGSKLYFHEHAANDYSTGDHHYWNLTQVLKANNEINNLAKTIKDNKLSPFEALLFICTWAQKNLSYYDTENTDETTNTITAAINNKKVRCVGFTQFVAAVINCLGSEYMSEYNTLISNGMISVAYEKEDWYDKKVYCGNHAQLKCYLMDKKYNIDGEVIADALGIKKYGPTLELLKIKKNTILARIPIAIFSDIISQESDYKIYSDRNLEIRSATISRNGILVAGKEQKRIIEETEANSKIAKGLQAKIDMKLFAKAYEKIIPLIFPELKDDDIIAPIMSFNDEGKYSFGAFLEISQGKSKDTWLKEINAVTNNTQDNENTL